ncbi:MAG TPA: hypothetical protein VEZ14_10150 [Dehalococcoidia bacterium]|nr:hypothetical protein [Dehalococcoidia bacterium]
MQPPMVLRRTRGLRSRIGRASRIDIEYFCRSCKGHYSASVPVGLFQGASCRCGSRDLFVYSVVGDQSAPLLPLDTDRGLSAPAGPNGLRA